MLLRIIQALMGRALPFDASQLSYMVRAQMSVGGLARGLAPLVARACEKLPRGFPPGMASAAEMPHEQEAPIGRGEGAA